MGWTTRRCTVVQAGADVLKKDDEGREAMALSASKEVAMRLLGAGGSEDAVPALLREELSLPMTSGENQVN